MASFQSETGDGFEIRRNNLGWGGVARLTRRPFAVLVAGEFLVDRADRIRTFGSREAARKAALIVLHERSYLDRLLGIVLEPGSGNV